MHNQEKPKLQSGKMDFDIKKTSLTDIVVGAVEINKPYADEKKVVFDLCNGFTAKSDFSSSSKKLARVADYCRFLRCD